MSTSSKVVVRNTPWARQPQLKSVLIDLSNDLTKGLTIAYCPSIRGSNLINPLNSTIAYYGNGLYTNQLGIGARPTYSGYSPMYINGGVNTASSSSFTIVVATIPTLEGANPGVMRDGNSLYSPASAGTGTNFCIFQGAGSNRPWVRLNGVDILKPTTGEQLIVNIPSTIAFSVKNASSVKCAWNGKIPHQSTHSTSNAGFDYYWIGAQNVYNETIGGIHLFLHYDRALNDAELVSITTNPWQIFQPQRSYDFSKFSGGQGVTTRKSWFLGASNPIAAPNSSEYVVPAVRNMLKSNPDYLWTYDSGRGMKEHVHGAHADAGGQEVTIATSAYGAGPTGSGGSYTGITGIYSAGGKVDLTGTSQFSSVTVVVFNSHGGDIGEECVIWRMDDNTYPSKSVMALDYFTDGTTFKLRPLIATLATEGWTTSIDRTTTTPLLKIPYVITTRWISGGFMYSTVKPLGQRFSTMDYSAGVAPAGFTYIRDFGPLATQNFHILGSGYQGYPVAAAPITVLAVALFKRALSVQELSNYTEDPQRLFGPIQRKLYVDNTPKKLYAPALVTTRKTWTSQPPEGTQIDWNNPLSTELVAAYSGRLDRNLVTNKSTTVTGSSGAITSTGLGFKVTSSTDKIVDLVPGSQAIDMTIAFSGVFGFGGGSGNSRIVHMGDMLLGAGIFITSNGSILDIACGNSGIVNLPVITNVFDSTRSCNYVITFENIAGQINATAYRDGVLKGTSVASVFPTNTSYNVTLLNRSDGIRSAGTGTIMTMCCIANRVWRGNEVFNPWQIFQPIRQLTHVFKEAV